MQISSSKQKYLKDDIREVCLHLQQMEAEFQGNIINGCHYFTIVYIKARKLTFFYFVCSSQSVSVRYLSRISEVHEDSPSEVPGSPNPSTPDSLFGIAPRKLRNVEDEDFSPNYSQPNKTGNSSEISSQQNYFSQAWAAEKQRPLSRNSDRMEEQLLQVPTAQQSSLQSWTQSRVWLTAPNSQVSTQGANIL